MTKETGHKDYTRDRRCGSPGGEAQACCRGEHNTAGQRSKLHLESGHNVRKPSRASIVNGIEIVGQIDQKLSAMGYTEPNSGVRSIDAPRAAVSGDIDAILRLQASRWDDVARTGRRRSQAAHDAPWVQMPRRLPSAGESPIHPGRRSG